MTNELDLPEQPPPGMIRCHICPRDLPTDELLSHLSVHHPDAWGEGFATWPDGAVVIIDEGLRPDDFEETL